MKEEVFSNDRDYKYLTTSDSNVGQVTSTISTWAKKKLPVLLSCEEYMTLKKLKSLKIVIAYNLQKNVKL